MTDLSDLRPIYRFIHGNEVRELVDAEGPPTPRQLAWLARHNLLRLVGLPDQLLSKGFCAAAIDRAIQHDDAEAAEGGHR